MARLAFCVVFSALVAVMIGCETESDGSVAAGGTAGDAGTSGTGGASGNGGGAVALTAMVTEAPSLDDKMFTGPPLEGVELCEVGTTNCATTDVAGMATIMLVADKEFSFRLSKEGYAPYLAGDVSDAPLITTGNYPMINDALMQAESERLMFEWPSDSTGLVALAAFALHAGVTWEIDDEDAIAYYHDDGGLAQTNLTATTDYGRGGFYEVAEGTHEVEFAGTVMDCTVGTAWPAGSANHIRVPARAGHISFGSMSCDEP